MPGTHDSRGGDFLERVVQARLAAVGGMVGSLMDEVLSGFARETADFRGALTASPDVAVIAEMKKASPSAGPLAADPDVAGRVRAYESGGAAAVSVLTEPQYFAGDFDDLRSARDATRLPLLCKDFVVHHNQILLARARGADCVLLIVSVLGERTAAFVSAAASCGLQALVEVHDEAELEVAHAAGSPLLAVNSRDLRTLEVDRECALELVRQAAAEGYCVVAASGVTARSDVEEASDAGARAVLVGEALMRAEDPEEAVRSLTGVRAKAAVFA